MHANHGNYLVFTWNHNHFHPWKWYGNDIFFILWCLTMESKFPPIETRWLILSYIPNKSWKPCDFHVDSTWFPVDIMWFSCGNHIVSMWFLNGHHVFSMWIQHVTMWTPCGFQVDTTWFPCGQDHFHPLQMRSRSMEIRSRLDLFLDYPHDGYEFLANFWHFRCI